MKETPQRPMRHGGVRPTRARAGMLCARRAPKHSSGRETWSRMQRKSKEQALMNTLKTVAAFSLALLAAPLVHASIPFPAAALLRTNATTHSREGSPSNAQSTQKVIKEPAEYNAYIAALNRQDPAARAAAMEAFVKQYPASIVKIEALEQARPADQQAGNAAKVLDGAQRIITLDPGNVRALAILAYLKRAAGTPEAAKECLAYAQRGLDGLTRWTIPEGTSEADFQKLRTQMSLIFYGAAGWGHLQAKEFGAARDNYLKALQIDPTDFQNSFQLGYALRKPHPMGLNGFC